jgi:ribosome maturation factor RimP
MKKPLMRGFFIGHPQVVRASRNMAHRLQELLEPVVEDLGYELWHLESVGGGSKAVLRLYIDAPAGVDIDDCETVSHEVSAVLDVADDGQASYQLEVSSPGLDRPLVTAAHFRRFLGERARVHLYAPISGRRRFRGVIEAVNGESIDLACDDAIYTLAIGDMAKARLDPIFDDGR